MPLPSEEEGGAEEQPGTHLEQESQHASHELPFILRSKRIRRLPRQLHNYVLEPNDGEVNLEM